MELSRQIPHGMPNNILLYSLLLQGKKHFVTLFLLLVPDHNANRRIDLGLPIFFWDGGDQIYRLVEPQLSAPQTKRKKTLPLHQHATVMISITINQTARVGGLLQQRKLPAATRIVKPPAGNPFEFKHSSFVNIGFTVQLRICNSSPDDGGLV